MADLHEKSTPPPIPNEQNTEYLVLQCIHFLSSRKTFATFQAFPTEFRKTHYLLSSAERLNKLPLDKNLI